ncbi:conserved membrane hypothetical protein [Burkholderia sp. 8Y]|uniref:DUF421 domain-containing protein n=1 Tax=Burkholderia sp. 8Y TaxID=2653133 RepID=UPI0012F296E9|nr:YetF domain-containing protein [Burkholderia sp. 8Y]VXB32899.1 conserved membrane hypothetical protein [Burkholderia sp. 8Y]
MNLLKDIFGTQGHVTTLQECARAAIVFCWGLFLVRVAGRRIFGRWAALDIVVSIIVGSNLSRVITGSAPLVGTLVATGFMIAAHWVLAHLASRYRLWAFISEGSPITLFSEGEPCTKTLLRYGVSENDINEALSQNGIDHVRNVQKMTLEPSGKISVSRRNRES